MAQRSTTQSPVVQKKYLRLPAALPINVAANQAGINIIIPSMQLSITPFSITNKMLIRIGLGGAYSPTNSVTFGVARNGVGTQLVSDGFSAANALGYPTPNFLRVTDALGNRIYQVQHEFLDDITSSQPLLYTPFFRSVLGNTNVFVGRDGYSSSTLFYCFIEVSEIAI